MNSKKTLVLISSFILLISASLAHEGDHESQNTQTIIDNHAPEIAEYDEDGDNFIDDSELNSLIDDSLQSKLAEKHRDAAVHLHLREASWQDSEKTKELEIRGKTLAGNYTRVKTSFIGEKGIKYSKTLDINGKKFESQFNVVDNSKDSVTVEGNIDSETFEIELGDIDRDFEGSFLPGTMYTWAEKAASANGKHIYMINCAEHWSDSKSQDKKVFVLAGEETSGRNPAFVFQGEVRNICGAWLGQSWGEAHLTDKDLEVDTPDDLEGHVSSYIGDNEYVYLTEETMPVTGSQEKNIEYELEIDTPSGTYRYQDVDLKYNGNLEIAGKNIDTYDETLDGFFSDGKVTKIEDELYIKYLGENMGATQFGFLYNISEDTSRHSEASINFNQAAYTTEESGKVSFEIHESRNYEYSLEGAGIEKKGDISGNEEASVEFKPKKKGRIKAEILAPSGLWPFASDETLKSKTASVSKARKLEEEEILEVEHPEIVKAEDEIVKVEGVSIAGGERVLGLNYLTSNYHLFIEEGTSKDIFKVCDIGLQKANITLANHAGKSSCDKGVDKLSESSVVKESTYLKSNPDFRVKSVKFSTEDRWEGDKSWFLKVQTQICDPSPSEDHDRVLSYLGFDNSPIEGFYYGDLASTSSENGLNGVNSPPYVEGTSCNNPMNPAHSVLITEFNGTACTVGGTCLDISEKSKNLKKIVRDSVNTISIGRSGDVYSTQVNLKESSELPQKKQISLRAGRNDKSKVIKSAIHRGNNLSLQASLPNPPARICVTLMGTTLNDSCLSTGDKSTDEEGYSRYALGPVNIEKDETARFDSNKLTVTNLTISEAELRSGIGDTTVNRANAQQSSLEFSSGVYYIDACSIHQENTEPVHVNLVLSENKYNMCPRGDFIKNLSIGERFSPDRWNMYRAPNGGIMTIENSLNEGEFEFGVANTTTGETTVEKIEQGEKADLDEFNVKLHYCSENAFEGNSRNLMFTSHDNNDCTGDANFYPRETAVPVNKEVTVPAMTSFNIEDTDTKIFLEKIHEVNDYKQISFYINQIKDQSENKGGAVKGTNTSLGQGKDLKLELKEVNFAETGTDEATIIIHREEATNETQKETNETTENTITLSSPPYQTGQEITVNIKTSQSLAQNSYKMQVTGPKKYSKDFNEKNVEYSFKPDKAGKYTISIKPLTGLLESVTSLLTGSETLAQKTITVKPPGQPKWKTYCAEQNYNTEQLDQQINCIQDNIVPEYFEREPPENTEVGESLCQDLLGYDYNPEKTSCQNT